MTAPPATLVYHPVFTHAVKFLGTTTARDKLLRTLQYFARFYGWYLLRTNGLPRALTGWKAMAKQASLARKLLRVGKALEHARAAAEAAAAVAAAHPPTAASMTSLPAPAAWRQHVLAVARQLAYAIYLTAEMATLPDAMGAWPSKRIAPRLVRIAARCWLVGLVCGAVAQTAGLVELGAVEKRVDKFDGEGVLRAKRIAREKTACKLQLTTDLCDMTIPLSTLGLVKFDDGFVGICGVVSSLIGLRTQWNNTA